MREAMQRYATKSRAIIYIYAYRFVFILEAELVYSKVKRIRGPFDLSLFL